MNFLIQAESAGVFLQLLDESDKKETRIAVNWLVSPIKVSAKSGSASGEQA